MTPYRRGGARIKYHTGLRGRGKRCTRARARGRYTPIMSQLSRGAGVGATRASLECDARDTAANAELGEAL